MCVGGGGLNAPRPLCLVRARGRWCGGGEGLNAPHPFVSG